MYKVLIVEDVDIVREDLKKIINWKEHGFALVGEAKNGEAGLALYHIQQPDIIITDIRMPVMTGLQMIEEIRKTNSGVQFILLTAFEEFEYAKTALYLNIHSYVMKYELDDEILLKELNRQKDIIEQQKSIGRMKKTVSLKKLLDGDEGEEIPHGFVKWLGRSALLIAEILPQRNAATPPSRQGDIQTAMYEHVRQMNDYERIKYEFEFIDLTLKEHLIFLKVTESMSDQKSMLFIHSFCRIYQQALYQEYETDTVLAFGGYVYKSDEIPPVYQDAKRLARQRVFYRKSCIIDSQHREPSAELKGLIDQELNSIREGLGKLDLVVLEEKIARLFIGLLGEAGSNELLESCVRELVYTIAAKNMDVETGNITELLDEIVTCSQNENLEDLAQMFVKAIKVMNQAVDRRYSKRINSMIRYIDEHYNSDVSLRDLAFHFDLSMIYVSQLFKKEVGITVSAYLTKVRIREAIALLESGRFKVYEISEMVGYQSVQYFSKIFKNETGKKPSEFYRKA